jgi:hypothetical protein
MQEQGRHWLKASSIAKPIFLDTCFADCPVSDGYWVLFS